MISTRLTDGERRALRWMIHDDPERVEDLVEVILRNHAAEVSPQHEDGTEPVVLVSVPFSQADYARLRTCAESDDLDVLDLLRREVGRRLEVGAGGGTRTRTPEGTGT